MKVRFTIYSVKFGLVFGIAGFVLQYAIKHFTYLTIMKSMMARIDCILGLVGLIGMLIATIAFIAEISKRIINHDNLFNFFKAIFLTALIKKALLRVDIFDHKTGRQNAVSKSFNNYVRWSYGDFEHNKMLVKVKIPFNGQARKMWQENKATFVDAITSHYPEYNFSHEKERGYYVLVGIKNKKLDAAMACNKHSQRQASSKNI